MQLESCIKQPEPYQLRKELMPKIALNNNFQHYLDSLFNIEDFVVNDNISFVNDIIAKISICSRKTNYSRWINDEKLFFSIRNVLDDPCYQKEKIPFYLSSFLHYPIQKNNQQKTQRFKRLKNISVFFFYQAYLKLPFKLQNIARSLLKNKLHAMRNVSGYRLQNQ